MYLASNDSFSYDCLAILKWQVKNRQVAQVLKLMFAIIYYGKTFKKMLTSNYNRGYNNSRPQDDNIN